MEKKILEATVLAAKAHRFQKRKADDSSYICHPLEVAEFLSSKCGIDDIDVIIAAILHDTVEDNPNEVSIDFIREKFGDRVASIVDEVSDDRNLSRVERKRAQLEHVLTMTDEAKMVKAADMWHNIGSLKQNPPGGWEDWRIKGYVYWKKLIFFRGNMGDLHPVINQELQELFDSMVGEGEGSERDVEEYFNMLL